MAAAVLRALQQFLGDTLSLTSAAVTFRDVQEPLRAGGVDEETIQGLRELFWRCEACRYGGFATGPDSQTLVNWCYELAGKIAQTIFVDEFAFAKRHKPPPA